MASAIPFRIRNPISRVLPADSCASLTINLCCCRRGQYGGFKASLYNDYFLNGIYTEFFTGSSLTDLMILLLDLDNATFNITNLHRVDDFALLNEVIRLDNLDVVHAMLDHPECDVNVTDGKGDTALHLAADKHRSDNGQYLSLILNSRSNADIGRLDALQRTPLVRAVLAGNHANVNLLLDRCFGNAGEDVIGRRDVYGKSALDYALQLNQREVVVAIRNWFVPAARYY